MAKGGALDWLATAASMATLGGVLGTYDLVQRVAIRFGPVAHQRAVSDMARKVLWSAKVAGARFRAEGLERAAGGGPLIIVMNHQSLFDIAMCSSYLAHLQPRYIAKDALARGIPGVSYNLRHGGSACIDRGDAVSALAAIEGLAHHILADGWSVCIFPEGTRSRTGVMRPFRTAGFRTLCLRAPGIPVLPVTTSGGARLFRHNLKPVVRGVEMLFRVHPPVQPPDAADTSAFGAFVRRLEQTIRGGLPVEDQGLPDDSAARGAETDPTVPLPRSSREG